MAAREYQFGKFVLRPSQRQLLANGRPLKLGKRGYELLLALVERAGEAVARDELFERVWQGRVVIDDNLKVQVMTLRSLLGAEAVITLPGHGYRFGLPVKVNDGESATALSLQIPASGTLIGREPELAQLPAMLKGGALVTVVGSGGVGKTRLALAAAASAARRFADGTVVVELAGLREPQLLCANVVRQLKLAGEGERMTPESLAQSLAPLALLLVLDNCEHLLEAAAELGAELLAHAPAVAVLATSQEPLGVQGESVLRIAGLAAPADDAPPADVEASGAATLLAERIRGLDHGFRIDARNAAAVAALCRRLDGIPLALELAAARVPLLGVEGVLSRLDEQLSLLTRGARDAPSRQQTLRAALQWSHELLDASQKAAFRRLAVFADSFRIESAEQVCAAPGDDRWQILDALHALVDKSLVAAVVHANGGGRRLRLLVTAREFAFERLVEAGEREAAQARHADAVVAIFERALDESRDAPLLPWIERLGPEVADLRAALRWASGADGDPRRLVALVAAAGYFWNAAGLHREAQRWIDIAQPLIDERTPLLHAARFWLAAAYRSVDPTAPIADAVAAAQRAAGLFRALGDACGEYRMLAIQAHHARRVDPPLDAAALLEQMRALERPEWSSALRSARLRPEGVALARSGRWQEYRDHFAAEAILAEAEADELRQWGCQHHVSLGDLALGQPARAAEGMNPVVQRLRELGYLRWQWTRPAILLMALIEAGAVDEATAALRETLPLLQVAGAVDWMPEHFALWALIAGYPQDAAGLLGWSDSTVAPGAEGRNFHREQVRARVESRLAAQLDAGRINALRSAGQAWDDHVALQHVLALLTR
jgi:predicted ATPase/DNA-binding winged helix-turn-helix (wHTH) protein